MILGEGRYRGREDTEGMKNPLWDERSPLRGKCEKERDGEKNHPDREERGQEAQGNGERGEGDN